MTRHSQGKYCSEQCRRAANRASWVLYGKRNRDKRRAYHRSYYRANREAIIKKTTEYARTMADGTAFGRGAPRVG
jgi:hypothetical protein